MSEAFAGHIRSRREDLLRSGAPDYSLRRVATRVGVSAQFLSRVEKGEALPSEAVIERIAHVLDEDPDVLFALAGKVPEDLREVIRERPVLFSRLLRELRRCPSETVERVVREVRDGEW